MPASSTTQGITVEVKTVFLEDYSKPGKKHYLYCYKVKIINESDRWVKLLSRHWVIIDSDSHKDEVKGDGVIGKQPELEPGASHEYISFCPMQTEFGTMEGSYRMVDKEGSEFDIEVPRFFLASNLHEFPANKFKRGQIVFQKHAKYRGVISDFDMYFLNDERWYESVEGQPSKDQPWYYVLADQTNQVHYVAEENLEPCEDDSEIEHPLMNIFFDGFTDNLYIRNDKGWDDIK